jgi:hypothetical protein
METNTSVGGAVATHTAYINIGDASADQLDAVRMSYQNASIERLDESNIAVGVDDGDDEPGTTFDTSATENITSVDVMDNGTLLVEFDGSVSLTADDEIVVELRGVENPDVEDSHWIELTVDPSERGGNAAAAYTTAITPTATDAPDTPDTPDPTDAPDTPDASDTSDEEPTQPQFGVPLALILLSGASLMTFGASPE